jgi:RND superfamily putative drug exporter
MTNASKKRTINDKESNKKQLTGPLKTIISLISGRKTKWLILVAWFAIMAIAGPLAGKLNGVQSNNASTWLPGKAESTKVLAIEDKFQDPNHIPAVIVYERTSALDMAGWKNVIDPAHLKTAPGVTGDVTGPIVSNDHKAAQAIVTISFGNDWNNASKVVASVKQAAQSSAPGVTVHITGAAGNIADNEAAFNGIDTTLLFSALAVVTVLLLLTYRSPLLWLLPLISAAVALNFAQATIYLLAKNAGLTVNGQSLGILTVLVFGAATDYALLLIARYREELHNHEDRHEAMALTLRRAAPAIIASASTVILGMLCLLVAQLNPTKSLGPVTAIGIGVGLISMLTLLPALLVIFGRWIFWPRVPKYQASAPIPEGVWAKVGHLIAKRPRTTWMVTAAILAVLAIGTVGLKANGLSTKDSYRTTPDSVVGEEALARHFTTLGNGSPVVIVGNATSASQLHTVLTQAAGITAISDPMTKDGNTLLEATLTSNPTSTTAFTTIDQLRTVVHAIPNANAQVGGDTAITLDTQRASERDRAVIIPLMLIVVLVILSILLRSLVAPLLLVGTVVLSFGATLGLCTLIFNHLLKFGGADASYPLFVFVFLVALGIDYNIFLMTRVREETGKHGTRRGALIGLAATGAVITSAGAVLAGTFSALATLPLTFLTELGFSVALGILIDTFIVRSVLVTALTLDVGHWMWWPSKLAHKRDDPKL